MSTTTDSIAITGISGRFPNCSNIEEFQKALFSGVDLISEKHDRWSSEAFEISPRLGIIKDFDRLDADFFGINPKDANAMDPRLRKLLEVTYEALIDAGLNPTKVRGSNVGVFLGVHSNEREDLHLQGDALSHACTLFANVISFYFDFKGPSFSISSACATSFIALETAIDNILSGKCDMAVVTCAQFHFDPIESMELTRLGVMSKDGCCKPFDSTRTGYTKAECVMTVVIQKVEDSRRIYGTVAGIGNTCEGFRKEGLYFPSNRFLIKTFEQVFQKYNINPLDVGYVETHATATAVGDTEELQAVRDFYKKDRKTPVLIGSVKGNVGHTEICSGLIALMKVILAIQYKTVPGNIHYNSMDSELSKTCQGTLQVVTKNTPLPDGLIALNCYGLTGSIAVLVLRPFTVNNRVTNCRSHRLVQASGRTHQSVQLMLESVIKNKRNEEFLGLFDEIHSADINNHPYRGYAVLSQKSHYEISQCSSKKRPVWFLYSGLGSQMPNMAKELMEIETFRNTMNKCAQTLKPYGIDLIDIVVNGTEDTLNDIIKTFTSITAVAVSLTDVLTSLNIKPSGIIGHSLGETGCAYADGLITAEQAVLFAYTRGIAVVKSRVICGAMASVGLSIEECLELLPEEVYIACDNTDTNVTISGPEQTVLKFVDQLKQKGVFTRVIKNVADAFHSPHVTPAATEIYNLLNKIFSEKKTRSERWLSSTFEEDQWNSEVAKNFSSEYFYYNVVNRVQFRQLLKHIPQDAIILEIAPRGVLQPLLKRARQGTSTTVLSFGKPGNDNMNYFLSNLGAFYNNGGDLNLKKFYDLIKYPVNIDTPCLSSLVRWDHQTKWDLFKYNPCGRFGTRILIDLNHQNYQFLKSDNYSDRVVFPSSGYIVLAWQVFARMRGRFYTNLPVVIENFKVLESSLVLEKTDTNVIINILQKSGDFEIFLEDDQAPLLATGRIKTVSTIEDEFLELPALSPSKDKLKLTHDDFYYSMHLRGHDYTDAFKGFVESDLNENEASLKWEDNWVTFLDTMLQYALHSEMTKYSHLTHIDKIVISSKNHTEYATNMVANYYKEWKTVRCGRAEIRNIQFTTVKKQIHEVEPILKIYTFVPYNDISEQSNSFEHALNVAVQIVVENSGNSNISVGKVGLTNDISFIQLNTKEIKIYQIDSLKIDFVFDLIVVPKIQPQEVCDLVEKSKFVFTQTDNSLTGVDIIYQHGNYVLFRKSYDFPKDCEIVTVNNNSNEWIEKVKNVINRTSRLYLISDNINFEIIDLFGKGCSNLRLFVVRNNQDVEIFSLTSSFYAAQIKKDLAVNIYKDTWGTYRNLFVQKYQLQPTLDFQLLRYGKEVKWTQKSPFASTENVRVYVAGFPNNLSDLEDDASLGFEYSGVDTKGNNVMGLVSSGALSNSVMAHPEFTWNFSKELSFEEAATIPLAYTIAYYALFIRNDVSRKTVLIHNITNNYSFAAAVLSIRRNCSVFLFINNVSESEILSNNIQLFAKCKVIKYSEKESFCKTIMKQTSEKGVDLVINCNSDKLLKLSQKCSKQNASFVEINNNLKQNPNFVQYITIKDVFEESSQTRKKIASDLETCINQEFIVPLKCVIFDKNEIAAALKHTQDDKNGCLITIKNTSKEKIFAVPRTYFDPSKSYIIIGGLGGFGFELARWMVERGATKLILNHPNDLNLGYHASNIQKWQKSGVVQTNTIDTSTLKETETLINLALQIAPIGGIFNSACIDDYELTLAAESVKNLDIVSRKFCKNLDYFVVVSSLSYNHRFVNPAVMSVCRTRKEDGLSGLVIKYGPLADVKNNIKDHVSKRRPQSLASCLSVIDQFLQQNEAVVASFIEDESEEEVKQEKTFVDGIASLFGFKRLADVDKTKTLFNLGVDSIMVFEIATILEKKVGVTLSHDEVRNLTFGDMIQMKDMPI